MTKLSGGIVIIKKRLEYSGDIWSLFKTLNRTPAFLLDSSRYHEEMGRFSFMGWNPRGILRSRGRMIEYLEEGHCHCWEGEPLDALENLRQDFKIRLGSVERVFPFNGGLVGYISYDMGKQIENLDVKGNDDLQMYDQYWGVYDAFVAADHSNNEMWVVGINENKVKVIEEEIYIDLTASQAESSTCLWMGNISSNFSRQEYFAAIKEVKEHIRQGNIYQVNLSQRFSFGFRGNTLEYYDILRKLNPSNFAAFLHFAEYDILSMSPERFIKIQDDHIETRPIKGTRARGKDSEEDKRLAYELQQSEKDRAELLMIVDLERNDLGRICRPGSVKVEDMFGVTIHAGVIHMDARVHGILPEDIGIDEILRNTFPGGSITGAPKIMAMNIIEDLEPTARGVYTGTIGYINFDGNCDLNIAIRTLIIKDNFGYYQAGGGLVADSDPEMEFEETLIKSNILYLVQKELADDENNQLSG